MHALIRKLSDGFLRAFQPIPRESRAAFLEDISGDIFGKSRTIHMFALAFHLATVISSLSLVLSGRDVSLAPLDWLYIITAFAAALVSAAAVFTIQKFRKEKAREAMLGKLVFAAAIALMILVALLTSYEFYAAAQYLRYILFCLVLSLLVSYSPGKGMLILFPSYAAFFASSLLINTFNPRVYTGLNTDALQVLKAFPVSVNLAGCAVLCVFIFAVNYRRNYLSFLNKQRILSYQRELEVLTGQLDSANIKLRTISTIDTLTKLNNRRALDDYVADIWPKCHSGGVEIAIMMFDIDFFKSYNDNYGHQAGDEGLRLVADVIKRNFSQMGGMLARYGGEEFIAVIPGAREEAVLATAERIRAQLEGLHIANPTATNKNNLLTLSTGVSIVNAGDAASMEECIKLADEALYSAKSRGRNAVVVDNRAQGNTGGNDE